MSRILTMLLSYKLNVIKWKGSSSFEFGVKSVLFSFGNEVDKENNKFPQTQICWRCCTLWVNDCLEKLEAWRNKWREEGTEKENHRRAFVLYFPHCRWFCVLGFIMKLHYEGLASLCEIQCRTFTYLHENPNSILDL